VLVAEVVLQIEPIHLAPLFAFVQIWFVTASLLLQVNPLLLALGLGELVHKR
jgi:hypothetical protein